MAGPEAEKASVENVSSTALWVATYRAAESKRPDALFRDEHAEALAGERGARIVAELPGAKFGEWSLAVRTRVLDDWILRAVNELGVDLVLNLGAGLDTRPYRLALPASLLWIEVDYPALTDYKEKILRARGAQPVCRLETLRADLGDEAERLRTLDYVARLGKRILVLTEGVVPYLTEQQASDLSRDLLARPQIQYWLQDTYSREAIRRALLFIGRSLRNAPLRFTPPHWIEFFEARGWHLREVRHAFEEGRRLKRPLPYFGPLIPGMRLLPAPWRRRIEAISGFAWFER